MSKVKSTCSESGCSTRAKVRGLCKRHYSERSSRGALPPKRSCTINGCENYSRWNGPCIPHRKEFELSGMKWCMQQSCKNSLQPMGNFAKCGDGLQPWCKSCNKEYRDANKERARLANTEWRRLNPGASHGIDADRFWRMLEEQRGECAICATALRMDGGKKVRPHIDHDHAHCPGMWGCAICVRSLLCPRCNHFLGVYQDNAYILERLKPTACRSQLLIDSARAYLDHWHTEMVKRGARKPDLAGYTVRWISEMVDEALRASVKETA